MGQDSSDAIQNSAYVINFRTELSICFARENFEEWKMNFKEYSQWLNRSCLRKVFHGDLWIPESQDLETLLGCLDFFAVGKSKSYMEKDKNPSEPFAIEQQQQQHILFSIEFERDIMI